MVDREDETARVGAKVSPGKIFDADGKSLVSLLYKIDSGWMSSTGP